MLEQSRNRAIAAFQGLPDRAVIFIGTADRLFENRRIRRDPFDAIGIDQLFQLTFGDEAAGQEIQPDRLAVVFKCFDGIHDACFLFEPVQSKVPASGGILENVNTSIAGSGEGNMRFPRVTPFTTYRSRAGRALWTKCARPDGVPWDQDNRPDCSKIRPIDSKSVSPNRARIT